jgi:phosphoribosylformimino-5-aminoimidazole carboxamide ribotide isomerase
MDLYAAIDLRDGQVVRLVEGDFARQTVYSPDPVVVARNFAAGGAPWIHVVDLDAARSANPANRALIAEIVAAVTVPIQVGGGIRTVADAAALFGLGVTRVVVGTAAVTAPGLVEQLAERWPGRVAVGLDHRRGEVMVRGWEERGGRRVLEVLPEVVAAGAVAVVVTDIERDGRLAGPDVVGLAGLLEATGAPLVASGGVASAADLRVLAGIRANGHGLLGAVVGKALYEDHLTVAEAVAACCSMDGLSP